MLTLQQIADIAGRHYTRMADAMIEACVRHAQETGEKFDIPERCIMPRKSRVSRKAERRIAFEEWRRMVERNSDTKEQHV